MSKHDDECNDGMGVITNDAALLHYVEGRVHEDGDVVCVTVQAVRAHRIASIILSGGKVPQL